LRSIAAKTLWRVTLSDAHRTPSVHQRTESITEQAITVCITSSCWNDTKIVRAEAGRLQEICIEKFTVNESYDLKDVQKSIGT
jgi:hypothetical protein